MRFTIQAACGCHTGKVRRQNEDNFFFDGKCLEREHTGLHHPVSIEESLKNGMCFAVFDGLGGEHFGEYASFAAARQMQQSQQFLAEFLLPERKYLQRLTQQLNTAVREEKARLSTERMGTTMVSLYFSGRYAYVCNVGDSRAYRLRNGVFTQLSEDHVSTRCGLGHRKAPLTQCLGYGSEEVQLAPYIAKGELQQEDMYLLCSDGLTDMLSNFEISDIMMCNRDMDTCARELIQAALDRGGRDNITVIVCRIG